MKPFLFSVVATLFYFNVQAQTVYTATQSSYRKLNSEGAIISKQPFRPLKPYYTISLYNNALVIDTKSPGSAFERYSFVRKINVTEDGGEHTVWNALDKDNNECRIMLKDYGTYTRIAIVHATKNYSIVYQTL